MHVCIAMLSISKLDMNLLTCRELSQLSGLTITERFPLDNIKRSFCFATSMASRNLKNGISPYQKKKKRKKLAWNHKK